MTPEELDNTLRSFMHELYQRSPHTRRQYSDSVRRLYAWAAASGKADAFPFGLRRADIVAWLADVAAQPTGRGGGKPRPATMRHLFAGARAFFAWLEREADDGWVSPFYKLKAPSVPESEKAILQPEQMARVLADLDKAKLWREAAMVSLIYDNGLRAASLVAIRNEDVDWEENVIQLQHVKGGKELPVPFGDATWRRLDRWRRHRLDKKSPWLFTGSRGKLTANGVYQIISKVFEGMGIEHVGPHLIRHSFAAAYMSDDSAQWQDLKEVGLWSSDTMPQRYARMAKRQRARVAHRRLSPVERLASIADEVG